MKFSHPTTSQFRKLPLITILSSIVGHHMSRPREPNMLIQSLTENGCWRLPASPQYPQISVPFNLSTVCRVSTPKSHR